jgi:glycosyltransferase involved in cell wall biosynthesis
MGDTKKFSIEPSYNFKDNLNFYDDPFGFHKIYNFVDGEFFIKKYEKKLLISKKIKNISLLTNKYEIIKNHNLTKSEITVIITSYNYEKYIEKSIKSVIKNKLKNIEVLVIDDNSSDNSLKKIINFLNKDINLTIIKKEKNTGTVDTRNIAIRESLGDYVFMLDADNEIYEDCLIKHLNYLKSNDLDAVYSKIDCFDELNNFIYHISNKVFNYHDLKKNNYIDAMAMFNKKTLIELGCYDNKILELGDCLDDWELWLRLGYNNKKIGFIDESLSRYLVKSHGINGNSKYFENEIKTYLNDKFQ